MVSTRTKAANDISDWKAVRKKWQAFVVRKNNEMAAKQIIRNPIPDFWRCNMRKYFSNISLNYPITLFAILAVNGMVNAAVLEEVVVTAQKRAESLQEVPIAVAVLSDEDLINQGVSGTQGLQAAIPGLVYNNTGATAQPFLRGVGTRLAQNGLDLSVATNVDDRYIARPTASLFELADIERIEVLKGPQGTLYGRNATGGAIRVITKDVDDEFSGTFKASAGNYESYTVSGTVNLPLADNFGMRITGLGKWRDGYAKNVDPRGRSEFDDLDYQAFRTKFRWDMSESATARLTLDYWQRDDLGGVENVDLSPGNLGTTKFLAAANNTPITTEKGKLASAMTDSNEGEEFSSQLRLDFSLGDSGIDLVSITTYNDFELDWIGDADGGSGKHLDAFVFEKSDGFSQEIQLLSNNDSALSWILGGYYFSDEHDYELTVDFSDVVPGFLFSQSAQSIDAESWAIFGQLSWTFFEKATLTLGGRYTEDDKDVVGVASQLEPVTLGAGVPIDLSDSWSEFTPKASLEYLINEDVMVYFTYARGFKSGGFNYPAVTSKPPAESALDPEILDMYEIGLKGDFLGSALRLSAAGYYYDYTDLQVTRAAAGVGAAVTTENAANAEIWGFDLDAVWAVTGDMTLSAGLNVLDTEYKDYTASAFIFKIPGNTASSYAEAGMTRTPLVADGLDMIRAPDFSFYLSGEYVFRLSNASLPIFLSYSYKGEYDFDFVAGPREALLTQDDYGLLNGRATYEPDHGKWAIALFAHNMTDEDYYDDNVANGAGIRVNRGAPRTYGVELSYNF